MNHYLKYTAALLGSIVLMLSLSQAQTPISVDLSRLYETAQVWKSDAVTNATDEFLEVRPLSPWRGGASENLEISGSYGTQGGTDGLYVANGDSTDGYQIQFTVKQDVQLDKFMVQTTSNASGLSFTLTINGTEHTMSANDYNSFNPGTIAFQTAIKNEVILANSSFTLTSHNPLNQYLAFRTLDFVVVPEPRTYALLAGLGALGFITCRRRKRSLCRILS
jgi:hypothetical protein